MHAPASQDAIAASSLLQLIWLASPALPVGGFSYSEGLEAAVEWAGVKDEATAEVLDDEAEEDLLAISKDFNLRELIEDELLMELPLVPMHEVCPAVVPMASSDEDFEQAVTEKTNPFAVLAGLRKNGG